MLKILTTKMHFNLVFQWIAKIEFMLIIYYKTNLQSQEFDAVVIFHQTAVNFASGNDWCHI